MTDPLPRLCYNENVLGPSPKALVAMQQALLDAHLYPIGLSQPLQEKLAEHLGHGLTSEQILLGAGCTGVLDSAIRAFVRPGDEVILPDNTFALYRMFIEQIGGVATEVPLVDYAQDLAGMQTAVSPKTTLIILCNPNNPTGTYLTHDALSRFLAALPPHIIVLLDEAYVECADAPDFADAFALLAQHPNLIVTRTFSKVYGLAGVRVGYAFGASEPIEQMRFQRLMISNTRPAIMGALAALDDREHMEQTVAMVQNGRSFFTEAFAELGIRLIPSQANFVYTVNWPFTAEEMCGRLNAEGITLRPTNVAYGAQNLRITIGTADHNKRIATALQRLLAA